jgi:hypothetical protein
LLGEYGNFDQFPWRAAQADSLVLVLTALTIASALGNPRARQRAAPAEIVAHA